MATPRRIQLLDVARGVATLGILKINIEGFAFPAVVEKFHGLFGGTTGTNLAVFIFDSLFFEGKMRALFCLLFGAGVMLYAEKKTEDGGPSAAELWMRRCLWLTLFGVMNAYVLMWHWDILFVYGITGLVIFPMRNLSYRTLSLIIAVWWLTMGTLTTRNQLQQREIDRRGRVMRQLRNENKKLTGSQKAALVAYEEQLESRTPDKTQIADETHRRRSGWAANYGLAAEKGWDAQAKPFYYWEFLEAFATMLLGIMLYRRKIITGERDRADYVRLAKLCFSIGLPLQATITFFMVRSGFNGFATSNVLLHAWLYDIVRWLLAIGLLSLLALFVKSPRWSKWTFPLSSTGRMALTNYLMQSIVGAFIFYGFGFGLFGHLDRSQLFVVCLAIWLAEMGWSILWLTVFSNGPVEWLWRSLVAWRRLPIRRLPRAVVGSGEPVSPRNQPELDRQT